MIPMNKEIIIHWNGEYGECAVLENQRLVEYFTEEQFVQNHINNIYIGKVKNIKKGINAAFVDIGLEKNGYLYLKHRMKDTIKVGDDVLVQVTKEESETKGVTLTMDINIPGKFLILTPFDPRIKFSRRINDEEAVFRLKELFHMETKDSGFIVRTDAIQQDFTVIIKELQELTALWEGIHKYASYKSCYSLLYSENDFITYILNNFLTQDVDKVQTDYFSYQEKLREKIKKQSSLSFLRDKISYYTDDKIDVYTLYKIHSQLEKALRQKIWMDQGSSLMIEETEAMTVIDVNSSKFTGKKELEETIYAVNLEAAEEILIQIRLRNLSGIIIVDFIDMNNEKYQRKLLDQLRSMAKKDRIPMLVHGITHLGLVEITRKKMQKSLLQIMTKPCSVCRGSGRIPT